MDMFLGLMIELPSVPVPSELQKDFVHAMKLFKKGQFTSSYEALTSIQKKQRSLDQGAYSLEFDWLLQLNKYACKELSVIPIGLRFHEKNKDLVNDCELESIIQQVQRLGLPPSKDNLEIELMMIYNWSLNGIKHKLNCDIIQSEKLLSCIRESLLRLASLADKSFSFVASYSTDALPIIVKTVLRSKEELSSPVYHLFYLLCFSASWLLLLLKKYKEALRLIRLLKEENDAHFSHSVEHIIVPLCCDSFNDFMTDLMNLTMAFCLISCQQPVAEAVNCLSSIKSEEWKMSVNYAIVSLHLNSGEAVKALALAKFILSSDSMSANAKWGSRFLNLIGCCFASQGKPYSAVECFRKAITDDPTYLLPLLNICFQYKVLKIPDAELKGLNLLLQEIQKRDDNEVLHVPESCNLKQPLPLVTPLRLTKADILYLLAEHYQELLNIEESIGLYEQLLSHLTTGSLLQVHICLPPLPHIYQEAAYAMYRSSHFGECISLCETMEKKCPETVREIQPGMLKKLLAEPSSFNNQMPNKMKCNPMFDPPSFGNFQQMPTVNCCAVGCKILMLKSLSLAKLGNTLQALDILKRIRGSLSVIHLSSDEAVAPMKKPRVELSEFSVNVEEVNEWTVLSSAVHCCLGVLHLQLEEKKEALVMLRIAILISPNNIEAYWHYAQLLLRESEREKAMKTWANIRSRLVEPFLGEKLNQVLYTITKEDVREFDENVTASDGT